MALGLTTLLASPSARADLTHDTIDDGAIEIVDVIAPGKAAESVAFGDLGAPRPVGTYVLVVTGLGDSVLVPHCQGRGAVTIDGAPRKVQARGSVVLDARRPEDTAESGVPASPRAHEVRIEIKVSAYEKRIACGERPRFGARARGRDGLTVLSFDSAAKRRRIAGAGEAVVLVPRAHDAAKPGALLVGAHPWNGDAWTYAAYRELLEEAERRDVVLLMPSGLGNSLYTEDAETEVMEAIDAISSEIAIDRHRVSLWGASMGGAGATTIAFHRPDRFASVTSFFGDSKYDLTTYVRGVLGGEAGARRVNALDVVDNARHLPVWLIHGEVDRSSPIAQSTMLEEAMRARGFQVELVRAPGMGHEAPLVVRHLREVVARAARARAPEHPARVSFRSVRAGDVEAYGVRIAARAGDEAFVDVERREADVFVLSGTRGVVKITLREGALGARRGAPVHVEAKGPIEVRWE